ncbi:MAG: lysoplasmalogenase [Atopobiaceae bacterium]|nr:lysoplasmalogenase [Atopobiaceae bacterium]
MLRLLFAVMCLILMTAFIIAEHRENWVQGVILKGCASMCFVALGVVCGHGAADERFARFVAIGLAIGALADVLLNLRYVFQEQGKLFFAVGTLVFLAGHVLYTVAVWPRAALPWLFTVLGAVATFFVMRWIFSQVDAEGPIRIIGIFYVGIVVILNCLAFSALIAHRDMQSLVFLAGSLLFFVSDIILILNTFGGDPQFRNRVINLTLYYAGQVLIALSVAL